MAEEVNQTSSRTPGEPEIRVARQQAGVLYLWALLEWHKVNDLETCRLLGQTYHLFEPYFDRLADRLRDGGRISDVVISIGPGLDVPCFPDFVRLLLQYGQDNRRLAEALMAAANMCDRIVTHMYLEASIDRIEHPLLVPGARFCASASDHRALALMSNLDMSPGECFQVMGSFSHSSRGGSQLWAVLRELSKNPDAVFYQVIEGKFPRYLASWEIAILKTSPLKGWLPVPQTFEQIATYLDWVAGVGPMPKSLS